MPEKLKEVIAKRRTTTDGKESAAKENRRIRRDLRGTGVEPVDIGSSDASRLQEAICAIAARGCAVQFGYTRDGGAICIRIVGDGEPYNEYVRATEDFDVYLGGIIEDFSPGGK